jgi:hypothetical protein
MLIKEKDPADKAIQQLETILHIPGLPKETYAKVEKELKTLNAGNRGEADSAYFINFHYRNSQNWTIIHDLRIEYGGNVAQIDHLMINRLSEFYVLESKRYAYGLKIEDSGEFLYWDGYRYQAMESPIEQNKRHAAVLGQLLKGENLLPKLLGMTLQPKFRPYVLVSPKSRVIRPKHTVFNTDTVIKADELFKQIEANFDARNLASAVVAGAKMISCEAVEELAQRLATHHKPADINYYARFGIQPVSQVQEPLKETEAKPQHHESQAPSSKYFCFKCGKPISQKVALFCFQNKGRFDGKAYCFDCQKAF